MELKVFSDEEKKENLEGFYNFFRLIRPRDFNQFVYKEERPDCSTVACIAGWLDTYAAAYFPEHWKKAMAAETDKGPRSDIFGIGLGAQVELFDSTPFYPSSFDVAHVVAVRCLREYLDTGVVNWIQAKKEVI